MPVSSLKTRFYTDTLRAGILAGKRYRELANELGLKLGTVVELAPRVSSFSPEEQRRYYLNRFIRGHKLNKTAAELETLLSATVEDLRSVRAKAIGVQEFHLRNLFRQLPEFGLTKREVVQRQLRRLHEAGAPIHNTGYMQKTHQSILERARSFFGNYWLALSSIGVTARPTGGGRGPLLSAMIEKPSPTEEAILRMRLAGTSRRKLADLHVLTAPEIGQHLAAITMKVKRGSQLARRLKQLDIEEETLEEMEMHKPPRDEVFDGFLQGKPIVQISKEAGLRVPVILRHSRSFTPAERIQILKAAHQRVKSKK